MADLSEQMTSLLEKEELPYADDATAATSRIRRMPKNKKFFPEESINLLESYKPEIREQRQAKTSDENVEKMKSVGTGLLTGFAGLPSDVIEGVNFVNDFLAEKGSPKSLLFKDAINEMRRNYGREAFDKKFTEITGIKSDGTNTAQIMGEILSPAGAFVATAKGAVKATEGASKLYNFFRDTYQYQTKLLRGDVPPGAGGVAQVADGPTVSTATMGGQMSDLIEKNKDIIKAGVDTAKGTKTVDSGDSNRPIINLSEIGLNTAAGKTAAEEYDRLEKYALNVYKDIDKIPDNIKDNMYYMTGAYKDANGKLKYKIPTADAQLNVGFLIDPKINVISRRDFFNADNIPSDGLTLEQILNFKDLYNQYPDLASNLRKRTADVKEIQYGLLKDIKVKNFDTYVKERGFDEKQIENFKNSGTRAIYSRNGTVETIYVSSGKLNEVKSDLLHEIQHAIQRREGHTPGAAPEDFLHNEKTEFGASYKALEDSINKEHKILKDDFLKTKGFFNYQVDQMKLGKGFLEISKNLDSAVEKLMLIKFNKTFQDSVQGTKQFYKPIPTDQYPKISDRGELLVDSTKNYESYNLRTVRFSEDEEQLIGKLVKDDDFVHYISQRLVSERQVRNKLIMEKQAHIMYENVIGEKQARKVQRDQEIYEQKLRKARETGRLGPNEDFSAEEKIKIFRRIEPSRYNVYKGQPNKTLDQDVDIIANIEEQ